MLLNAITENKQQSPNLTMPVESYKKLIWLIINYNFFIISITNIVWCKKISKQNTIVRNYQIQPFNNSFFKA